MVTAMLCAVVPKSLILIVPDTSPVRVNDFSANLMVSTLTAESLNDGSARSTTLSIRSASTSSLKI